MNAADTTTEWAHRFLLKNAVDHGLAVVKGKSHPLFYNATSLSDVLPAIEAADDLYDDTGAPDYDLHIWLALATMLIGAGDAIFSGVQARVSGREQEGQPAEIMEWGFSLNFSGTENLWLESLEDSHKRSIGEGGHMDASLHHGRFLTVERLTEGHRLVSAGGPVDNQTFTHYAPAMAGFAWRAMGEIAEKSLEVKMLSYPASVHPKLKDRTVANIALYIAAKLGDAGLSVRQHWFPEDTSRSFARYVLSDGIDHFIMDFHGGHLAVLLAHLDKYIGRDADTMGGIVLDDLRPAVIALDQAGDTLDSLPGHHP